MGVGSSKPKEERELTSFSESPNSKKGLADNYLLRTCALLSDCTLWIKKYAADLCGVHFEQPKAY
jgi:hypothetical protein